MTETPQEPVINKEQEYLEQLQRLQADFINFRNRVEKEKLTLIDSSKDQLLNKFLEVKDNFERIPKADKGVEMIYKQLNKIFDDEQVQEIIVNVNNPEEYETIATNNQTKEIQITRKGYRRKGKILRPAQIIFGTKEENEQDNQTTANNTASK